MFSSTFNKMWLTSHILKTRQETYPYSASKAGLHHMTRHLAGHHGGKGITFNSISPGPFQSKSKSGLECIGRSQPCARLMDNLRLVMRATLEAFGDVIVSRVPMGRIGSPEDAAGTCIFLASRAGAYINGATITLDGGSVSSPPHL